MSDDSRESRTVCRHADVVRVLHDHDTFSSVVSTHRSVPNGMDPPEHTIYRSMIDPYFSPERVASFEPACRRIAAALVDAACEQGDVDLMTSLALPFAGRVQCAYLGWPIDLAGTLIDWTRRNHEATLSADRTAQAAIADELEQTVAGLLRSRRADADEPARDLTEALLRETVNGQRLTLAEITSILRNWTMGEVGTIAASVGILVHVLACDFDLQYQLRRHLVLLPAAIEEILRMFGPLASNRRAVTRPVEIAGRHLEPGDRLTIDWVAANRDPVVFPEPDRCRLDRDPATSLLYGAGIHACPGAGLARLELRIVMEELLAAAQVIEPIPDRPAARATPPATGLAALPLRVIRAAHD
jgi:cytochrome P450